MRIGELAAAAGTTSKTLRFYEARGLLPEPARTSSGYRSYPPGVVGRLGFIRRGQSAGLSLAQIRQVLDIRDGGSPPCEHVRNLLAARLADLDAQIGDLTVLRETIADLSRVAAEVQPETCQPDQVCSYV